MQAKLLTDEELKRIASCRGRKRTLNADVFINQLLGHIAALAPKPDKPEKAD